jgi:hypothetical protein
MQEGSEEVAAQNEHVATEKGVLIYLNYVFATLVAVELSSVDASIEPFNHWLCLLLCLSQNTRPPNHQNLSFFLISNQWSIRTKSILIKISMKQKKANRMPQQPDPQLTNAQQQQQLTNAQQQQQLTNAQQQQQLTNAQQQMQYPVQQQMQYPVQQQMQYPVQQQMVFPGQVQNNVGQRTVGYYGLGSRNLQPTVE